MAVSPHQYHWSAERKMVSGKGKVNARGKFCWDKYWTMRRQEYELKGLRWIVDYDAKEYAPSWCRRVLDIVSQEQYVT